MGTDRSATSNKWDPDLQIQAIDLQIMSVFVGRVSVAASVHQTDHALVRVVEHWPGSQRALASGVPAY